MSSSTAFDFSRVMSNRNELLAPVVQTLDSAIHRINQYPADKYCYLGNQLLYGHWIKIYPSDSATTLWTTGWSMFATWKSLLKCARSMGNEILQQKNLMLIMCISSTEIDCKTVRIFAYSSTREQSCKRGWKQRETSFTRVRTHFLNGQKRARIRLSFTRYSRGRASFWPDQN